VLTSLAKQTQTFNQQSTPIPYRRIQKNENGENFNLLVIFCKSALWLSPCRSASLFKAIISILDHERLMIEHQSSSNLFAL
jgi:hypothetical protein